MLPKFVRIVEVAPRDGLQNEKSIISTQDKVKFINLLSQTGLKTIETTSFVSAKWVPQMGDAEQVYSQIEKNQNISYPVLVPNVKGLEQALKVGVKEIAIFGAASETFTQKNINCSINQSLERFKQVSMMAQQNNLKIRGYVSCVLGCPYEGKINPKIVKDVTRRLFDLGCYEVSLGDTTGMGNQESTQNLLNELEDIPRNQLAVHFHDTYGQAVPNVLLALKHGISVVDSSVGGIGGCPYAKNASGNVSTEKIIELLDSLGIECGVNKEKLKIAQEFIKGILNQN